MTPIRHEVSHKSVVVAFWVVVAIAVVISTGALWVGKKADSNAVRVEKAVCVQIQYLEGVARTTKALADRTGDPIDRRTRLRGAEGALKLANDLRDLGINCPPNKE